MNDGQPAEFSNFSNCCLMIGIFKLDFIGIKMMVYAHVVTLQCFNRSNQRIPTVKIVISSYFNGLLPRAQKIK